MKSTLRIFAISAVVASAAAVAHATTSAYSSGYAYAAIYDFSTYTFSGLPGDVVVTYDGSTFGSYSYDTTGDYSFSSNSSMTPSTSVAYSSVEGNGSIVTDTYEIDEYTFTNEANYDDEANWWVTTYADAAGFTSEAQDWGDAHAYAMFYIPSTSAYPVQESAAIGNADPYYVYSFYGNQVVGNWVNQGTDGYYPNPGYAHASTGYFTEDWLWDMGPGQTENVYVETLVETDSKSTTPGPAAIAPFALGLFGILRRRRRKR